LQARKFVPFFSKLFSGQRAAAMPIAAPATSTLLGTDCSVACLIAAPPRRVARFSASDTI
jgi:hypothetical protein